MAIIKASVVSRAVKSSDCNTPTLPAPPGESNRVSLSGRAILCPSALRNMLVCFPPFLPRAKEEAMRLALDCALTERGFHSGVPAHKPDTRLQWKFYAVAFAFLIVSDENAWK